MAVEFSIVLILVLANGLFAGAEIAVLSVRKTRLARRTMTPEVKAARAEWLNIYGAAKLLVECVLRLHGKVSLMPQIFDDLADASRATGEPANPAQRSTESAA